jgi:hypothetical protein
VQEEAEMLLRGTASSEQVVQLTIIMRYRKPSSDVEKGPARSTCTWLNPRGGIGMA